MSSRTIGIAAAIWGFSIFLSRIVGLAREAVLGRTLGTGAEADVYWTAFILPDFLNYLLAGGALSIVFIPIFQRHVAQGRSAAANEAFSVIASFLVVLLAVATLALWLAAPRLVPLLAPGFSNEQWQQLTELTRILLPAQCFHVIGGLCSAALQARDKHAIPAFAPLIYTLGIILGGWWTGTAEGFAYGVLAGSCLGPFLLPWLACWRAGIVWAPRWQWRHPDLSQYLARSLPIMLGFSIVAVDDWILRREGSLLPTGSASALTYAKNLMKVPMGVFGLALSVASFPTLARLVAEGQVAKMHHTLQGTLRTVLVLSFAAQAALTVGGADLAALVYGRQRIDPEMLATIGALTGLVSLGLAAWSAQTLLARGFYALGNTWTPALLGSVVALLAFPVYGLLREHWGLFGLGLASSAAILVYVWALHTLLERELALRGERVEAHWGAFLVRALSALGLAIGVGKGLLMALPQDWTLVRAMVGAGGAALVCVGAAAWLQVAEAQSLVRKLRRR